MEDPGGPEVPYAGVRHDKAGVAEFFRVLAESVDVVRFEPREYAAAGDLVSASGYFKARARTTRKEFAYDWSMWWRLHDGKVLGYQAYVDTAAERTAFTQAAGA